MGFHYKILHGGCMNICIFPGTFNPIHNGHLKMAEFALEKYKFDKIIFIPSYLPPHKEISSELAQHRFKMVELATASNTRFEVSDIEYKSDSKSYSIITVKKIIEQFGIKNRLNFIIGTDTLENLNTWHKAEELKELVHFIVFPRKGSNRDFFDLAQQGWDFETTDMDFVDISSTEIRAGEEGETNKLVEEYINKHGLYKS